MNDSDRTPLLVAAAGLGLLLFSYPLLSLFDVEARVFGVPVLWVYLFAAWAAVILLVALIARRPD